VGAGDVVVDEENHLFRAGKSVVREGQVITLNGATGEVIVGTLPLVDPELSGDFRQLLAWARDVATTKVRANADTPEDAKKAREFEADGIGLVRTEHMFFKKDRIQIVRQMIMATDEQARRKAVDQLLPFQREDFVGIFTAMKGFPVTIRLLDPPLHEFLPKYHESSRSTRSWMRSGLTPSRHQELGAVKARLEALLEANPMLGHRGCRLGITFPRDLRDAGARDHGGGVRREPAGDRGSARDHDSADGDHARDEAYRGDDAQGGGGGDRGAGRARALPRRHDDRGASRGADR
jgi:pyruvate,orthophosphate dikinase